MYINQRLPRVMADTSLPWKPPPSSPPTSFLLIIKTQRQTRAQQMKTKTLNPKGAELTKYFPSTRILIKSNLDY